MENRPEIKLTLAPADRLIEILGWITLLVLWIITLKNYSSLPQIIPIHFNAAGKADGFGSKSTFFLLPAIGTAVFIAVTVLNKYPHIFNYPTAITPENALAQYTNATRMMRYVKLIILVIFTTIVWITVDVATGKSSGLSQWFLPVTIGLVFIITSFFIYQSVKSS